MTITLAVIVAVFFGALGLAKIAALKPMREAAEHVGMTVNQYRVLGILELGGAGGIALGLVYPPLGVAAAAALVLMMVGAVIAHVRTGDPAARVLVPVATAALVAACGFVLASG